MTVQHETPPRREQKPSTTRNHEEEELQYDTEEEEFQYSKEDSDAQLQTPQQPVDTLHPASPGTPPSYFMDPRPSRAKGTATPAPAPVLRVPL